MKRGLFVIKTLDSRLKKGGGRSQAADEGTFPPEGMIFGAGQIGTSSGNSLPIDKASNMFTETLDSSGSQTRGKVIDEDLEDSVDLDPQETKEMAAQKRRELDILQAVISTSAKLIKLHPSLSSGFCRQELFQGVFKLISIDPTLNVDTLLDLVSPGDRDLCLQSDLQACAKLRNKLLDRSQFGRTVPIMRPTAQERPARASRTSSGGYGRHLRVDRGRPGEVLCGLHRTFSEVLRMGTAWREEWGHQRGCYLCYGQASLQLRVLRLFPSQVPT